MSCVGNATSSFVCVSSVTLRFCSCSYPVRNPVLIISPTSAALAFPLLYLSASFWIRLTVFSSLDSSPASIARLISTSGCDTVSAAFPTALLSECAASLSIPLCARLTAARDPTVDANPITAPPLNASFISSKSSSVYFEKSKVSAAILRADALSPCAA